LSSSSWCCADPADPKEVLLVEIMVGILISLVSLVAGVGVARWLGWNQAAVLRQAIGEDVVRALTQWRRADTVEITRDEDGQITAVRDGRRVIVRPAHPTHGEHFVTRLWP
jgi:hypothetical protein